MSQYQEYRYRYLVFTLDNIIMNDLLSEAEFIHDILTNPIRRIII